MNKKLKAWWCKRIKINDEIEGFNIENNLIKKLKNSIRIFGLLKNFIYKMRIFYSIDSK